MTDEKNLSKQRQECLAEDASESGEVSGKEQAVKESEPVQVIFEARSHRNIEKTQGRSIGGFLQWV